jgi:hypothetical protein
MARHLRNCGNASPEAKGAGQRWEEARKTVTQCSLTSLHQSHAAPSTPPPSYQSLPTQSINLSLPPHGTPAGNTPEIDQQFLRAFISAGWSYNSVTDPEVKKLFTMMNSHYKVPNRNKLSGPLLDREFERTQKRITERQRGHYATGQCDGWKDLSKNSLLAFLVTANGEVIACSISIDF